MKKIDTPFFREAVKDYYSLLCKEYPEKAALNLVAGHFSLSREQRIILYRGITDAETALQRKKKLTGFLKKAHLAVDGYNVFLTLANYLYGRPVFIGNDGILRDAGEVFGSVLQDDIFYRGIDLLLFFLSDRKIGTCLFYLDNPVSRSGELSAYLHERMVSFHVEGEAQTVKSPDFILKKLKGKIICTSDSVIIDKTGEKVCDLAYLVLRKSFHPRFLSL